MANNIRTTFVFENRPLIVWENVEGPEIYKLKLVKKDYPSIPVWEAIRHKSDLEYDKESNYLVFKYPDNFPPFEQLISYVIIGEAESQNSIVKAQGEFVLLESEIIQSFNILNSKLKNLPDDDELKKSFSDFFDHLSMGPKLYSRSTTVFGGTGPVGWNKFGIRCYTLQFSELLLDSKMIEKISSKLTQH